MSPKERDQVSREIYIQEVKDGLWSLKPFKVPGPDGLHIGFFQTYWNIVGSFVFEEVKEIFRSGTMPNHLNEPLSLSSRNFLGLIIWVPSALLARATLFIRLSQK